MLALGIFTGSGLFLSVLAERLRRARWAEAISVAQEQQLEELSRLNEELSQQSEELSQQSEELAQQNEELQTQSEEIQSLNTELKHREDLLQKLLDAARLGAAEQAVMQEICAAAKEMFGPAASAVLVLEPQGSRLAVHGQAGLGPEGAKARILPAVNRGQERYEVIPRRGRALLPGRPGGPRTQANPNSDRGSRSGRPGQRSSKRPFGVRADQQSPTGPKTAEQFRLVEWLAHGGHHRSWNPAAARDRWRGWRQSSSLPTTPSCPRTSTASSRPGTRGRPPVRLPGGGSHWPADHAPAAAGADRGGRANPGAIAERPARGASGDGAGGQGRETDRRVGRPSPR